jgi:hypothetical protein
MCSKCDKDGRSKKLCPLSFGLAVGIVSFFAVLIWTFWVMSYGLPPLMVAMHIPTPTLSGGFVHALLALIKGFLFGFFVALLYDLISCCFACKKSDGKCECENVSPEKKV